MREVVVSVLFALASAWPAFPEPCSGAQPQLARISADLTLGNVSAAEARLQPIAASHPDCPEVLLARARIEEAKGNVEAAANLYVQYTDLKPQDSRGFAYFGRLFLDQHDYARADALSAAAMEKNADDPAALGLRGQLLAMKGQRQEGRRLLEKACGLDPNDPEAQLAYADALRLAGRADDASAIYIKLVASPLPDVARTSKQRLADITASAKPTETPRTQNTNEASDAQPTPANQAAANATPRPHASPAPVNPSALSPAEHYQRGVSLWATNRNAAVAEFRAAAAGNGNPDAYYYLGLNFAEGRDPRTLGRAELVAALEFFQRARTGHFSAQARRYEDQLGQEFDRRHRK